MGRRQRVVLDLRIALYFLGSPICQHTGTRQHSRISFSVILDQTSSRDVGSRAITSMNEEVRKRQREYSPINFEFRLHFHVSGLFTNCTRDYR